MNHQNFGNNMIKKKFELFNSNSLGDIFKLKPSTVYKKLKTLTSKYTVKVADNGSKYYYDISDITDDIFNQLNCNKIFVNREAFENKIEVILKKRLKEEEKRLEQVAIDNIEKEKKREEKRLKEEELQLTSKLLKQNLEETWFKNNTINYIMHIGATNSGKTYNALQAMLASKSGIYLSPLRLLAFEVYDKIKKLGYPCNLITGEEKIIETNALFTASTIEMMNYNRHYDTVVIDECFMIGDENRGKSWLKAILESNTNNIHIISSLESENILKNILTSTNKKYTTNFYERKVPLISNVNKKYPIHKPLDKTIFVCFSRVGVLEWKYNLEKIGLNVSVLYGNLPPEVKKEQMRKFIDGENSVCISTDVIGAGINLPANHICFLADKKFDGKENRDLTVTEVKQIGGRAGRYLLSDVGNVWYHDMNAKKMDKKINHDSEILETAYCGINSDILFQIKGNNLYQKLVSYKKMNFIPNALDGVIKLENIDTYLRMYNSCASFLDKLDEQVAWKLLQLPMKMNTEVYWRYIVESILKKNKVKLEIKKVNVVSSTTQLKEVEDEIAKIELYSYFHNIFDFKENVVTDKEFEEFQKKRYIMIDNITEFLLNKKLSNVKLCLSCGKNIGVDSKHKNCDDCHYKQFKYYDDEY